METTGERNLLTISQIIKRGEFPVLVKVSNIRAICDNTTFSLADNQVIFLEKKIKVKYAHIRILNCDNDENSSKEETGSDVGNEVLIPMKYPGKLKFVLRPDRLTRFTSVSQVLQEMPRYVIVEEDTMAFPANGIGKNTLVQAKTKLSICRKYIRNGTVYLECSDGTRCFSFSERDRVVFLEQEDPESYKLCELVRLKLLPKAIRFEAIDEEDIALEDDRLSHDLYNVMSGTLELVDFVDVDVIVGSVRDENKEILIPSGLWESLYVEEIHQDINLKDNCAIKRTYGLDCETDFMETALYTLSVTMNQVTVLISPETKQAFKDITAFHGKDDATSDKNSDDFSYLTPIYHSQTNPPHGYSPTRKTEPVKLPAKMEKERRLEQLKDRILPSVMSNTFQLSDETYINTVSRNGSTCNLPSMTHGKTFHKPGSSLSKSLSDLSNIGAFDGVEDKASWDIPDTEEIRCVGPLTDVMSDIVVHKHSPQTKPEVVTLPKKMEQERPFKQLKDKIFGKIKAKIKTRSRIGSTTDLSSISHGKIYRKPVYRLSKSLSDIDNTSISAVGDDQDKLSNDNYNTSLSKSLYDISNIGLSTIETDYQELQRENHDDSLGECLNPLDNAESDIANTQYYLNNDLDESKTALHSGEDFNSIKRRKAIRDTSLDSYFEKHIPSTRYDTLKAAQNAYENSFTLQTKQKKDDSPHKDKSLNIYVNELEVASEHICYGDNLNFTSLPSVGPREQMIQLQGANKCDPDMNRNDSLPPLLTNEENNLNDVDTTSDFFSYTVTEVCRCFDRCGMKRFVQLCYENMLDGRFFRKFDLLNLKEGPFFLSNFEVLKLQKIIVEGWRPTV